MDRLSGQRAVWNQSSLLSQDLKERDIPEERWGRFSKTATIYACIQATSAKTILRILYSLRTYHAGQARPTTGMNFPRSVTPAYPDITG